MFKFFAICLFAVVACVAAKPTVLTYSSPYIAASPYTATYSAGYASPYAAPYAAYSAYPYTSSYSAYPSYASAGYSLSLLR